MTDTARILCTAKVLCTAKQPAGEGHSRLGFAANGSNADHQGVLSPLGLSTVMPDQLAQHFEVGKHITLVFAEGDVG